MDDQADADAKKPKLSVQRPIENEDDPTQTVSMSRGEVAFESVDVGSARKRGKKRQYLANVQHFWANTFLVIAILAIVSSQLYHIQHLFHISITRTLSLGMVEIVQGFVSHRLTLQFGDAYSVAIVMAQLLAPVVLILIGILARTNHMVYLLGLILYAVDTGIHVINGYWLAVGLHAVFTALLLHGYIASLRRIRA